GRGLREARPAFDDEPADPTRRRSKLPAMDAEGVERSTLGLLAQGRIAPPRSDATRPRDRPDGGPARGGDGLWPTPAGALGRVEDARPRRAGRGRDRGLCGDLLPSSGPASDDTRLS